MKIRANIGTFDENRPVWPLIWPLWPCIPGQGQNKCVFLKDYINIVGGWSLQVVTKDEYLSVYWHICQKL